MNVSLLLIWTVVSYNLLRLLLYWSEKWGNCEGVAVLAGRMRKQVTLRVLANLFHGKGWLQIDESAVPQLQVERAIKSCWVWLLKLYGFINSIILFSAGKRCILRMTTLAHIELPGGWRSTGHLLNDNINPQNYLIGKQLLKLCSCCEIIVYWIGNIFIVNIFLQVYQRREGRRNFLLVCVSRRSTTFYH